MVERQEAYLPFSMRWGDDIQIDPDQDRQTTATQPQRHFGSDRVTQSHLNVPAEEILAPAASLRVHTETELKTLLAVKFDSQQNEAETVTDLGR